MPSAITPKYKSSYNGKIEYIVRFCPEMYLQLLRPQRDFQPRIACCEQFRGRSATLDSVEYYAGEGNLSSNAGAFAQP
eukprot:5890634-Amphidinium_carterae.1